MFIHKLKVRYAETDAMGVAHHSSFFLWMESARVDYLDKNGYPYSTMEEEGFYLPVVEVTCRYLLPVKFNEELSVSLKIQKLTAVSVKIGYEIFNSKGNVVCRASTLHPVVTKEGKIVRMPQKMKDLFLKDLKENL